LHEVGLAERLQAVPGVADAVVVPEEAAIYIKVDTQQLDRTSLERLIEAAPVTC
jgi:multidrug efflux pump subunit AcrB